MSRLGWSLLAAAYGAVGAAGVYLFTVGHPDDGDLAPAGTSWHGLSSSEPILASFMARTYREAALVAIAYGLVGVGVAVGPVRSGERWAWVVSVTLPGLLAAVTAYEQKPEVKRTYGSLAAIALLGWIMSRPGVATHS